MPLGFRIVGPLDGARAVIDVDRALAAYAACDPAADIGGEAYVSAFRFGGDFAAHVAEAGGTAGFAGACYSPWAWCDLDGDPADLGPVRDAARRLVAVAAERYALDDDDVLISFTGQKGFCVGLPVPATASPSPTFHRVARAFAEALADRARVKVDPLMFTKVQPLRAPNSRHPRSGRFKVRLTADELAHLSLGRLLQLAEGPRPFEWYDRTTSHAQAAADWDAALRQVGRSAAVRTAAYPAGRRPRLNRRTLAFLRDGAGEGDRHRLLFSAAANLGEFGCPFDLAYALLVDAALDCGLPPKDVERQVRCGLEHAARQIQSAGTREVSEPNVTEDGP